MQQVTNKPSSSYYITPNKTNPKYKRSLEYVGGVSAGMAAFYLTKKLYNMAFVQIKPDFSIPYDISSEINKAKEIANCKDLKIFDISKLTDIEIKNPDGSTTIKTVKDQFKEFLNKPASAPKKPIKKSPIKRLLSNFSWYKNLQKKRNNRFIDSIISGRNAFYDIFEKHICINLKKAGVALFHEMGHNLNLENPILKQNSNIRLQIQKMSFLSPLLLLIAFSTNKHTKENPPQNTLQKTTNFVKENIGKIVFALSIPKIIDEGFASINGQKLAKQVLPKELVKYATKAHISSAASYISYAIAMGLMAFGANKVRDIYVDKMREKCKYSFTNQQI